MKLLKQNQDMECSHFLLRFFMFALSSVLFLTGAVGLIAGVWMKLSPSSVPGGVVVVVPGTSGTRGDLGRWSPYSVPGGVLEGWTTEDVEPLSYLLMAAGSLLLHVGLLGCCGAVRDGRWLRLLFSAVVVPMAVAAQAAGLTVALELPGEIARLLGPKALELMEENRVLALWTVGGVMALEAWAAASSMVLYCISVRRN